MRRRGILGALLCLVLGITGALAAAPTSQASNGSGAPTSVGQGREVVLRGVVERYAASLTTGADQEFSTLRTRSATYRLVTARGVRLPQGGTEVAVRGRLEGDVVTASEIRVLHPSARPSGRAKVPSKTRILSMRVYWTGSAPATPTEDTWKQSTITGPDRWFREVSAGRYSVSGTTTPWLKIKRPSGCGDYGTIMKRAKDKARAKGYSLSKYGRYIVYVPCDLGFIDGLGSMPGTDVWVWKTTALDVQVHEQGHNLGLEHASSRTCKKDGSLVTWSGSCRTTEYGDTSDAMGNYRAAHYNAYYKSRLGWLQSKATLRGSDTRTLTSAERVGGGLKALRVKVSAKKSYWIELREATGEDADLPELLQGVQVRYQKGRRTQLLDMMPGSGSGWDEHDNYYYEFDRSTLPQGSSWTSPEGIRITVVSESATHADVKVRFGAPKATAPDAPGPVTATPDSKSTEVSWTAPEDNGAIVTKYLVTTTPATTTKTVKAFTSSPTSTTLTGLTGGQQYTVSVRAVNEAGTSPAAQTTVTPTAPSVTIDSPAEGSSFTSGEQVTFTYTLSPATGDWDYVSLERKGYGEEDWTYDPGQPLTWDSSWAGDGTFRLRVVAQDQSGDSYVSAWRTVTIS